MAAASPVPVIGAVEPGAMSALAASRSKKLQFLARWEPLLLAPTNAQFQRRTKARMWSP